MNYEAELTEQLKSSTKAELYSELYNVYLDTENEISSIKNGKIAACKKKIKSIEDALKEIETEEALLTDSEKLRAQYLGQIRASEEEKIKRNFSMQCKAIKDKIAQVQKNIDEEKSAMASRQVEDEAKRFNNLIGKTKSMFAMTNEERTTVEIAASNEPGASLRKDYEQYGDDFFENLFKGQKNFKQYINLFDKALNIFQPKKHFANLSLIIIFVLIEILIQLFAAVFMDGVFFKTILLCIGFSCTGLAVNELIRYALLDLREERNKKSTRAIVDIVLLVVAMAMLWLSCSFLVSTFKRKLFKGICGLIFGAAAVFFGSIIYDEIFANGKFVMPLTAKEKDNMVIWHAMMDITGDIDDELSKIFCAVDVFKEKQADKKQFTHIMNIIAQDDSPVIEQIRQEFYNDLFGEGGMVSNKFLGLQNKLADLNQQLSCLEAERDKTIGQVKHESFAEQVETKLNEHKEAIKASIATKNKGKLLEDKQDQEANINYFNEQIKKMKANETDSIQKMQELKEMFSKKIDTPVAAKIDNRLPLGFAQTSTGTDALIHIEHNMKPVVIKCSDVQAENNGNEMSEIEEFVCHAFWGCVYNNMKETALHLYDESAAFSNLFYDRNVAAASQNRYIVHKIDANDVSRDIAEIIENKSRLTGKIEEYNRICLTEMRNIIKYDIIFIYGHNKLLNDKDFIRILNNTENWGIVPVLIINENNYADNADSEFIKAAVKNNAVYRLNRSAFSDKFVVEQNYIEKVL